MLKRAYLRCVYEREWLPVAVLLCLGVALRMIGLTALPLGLNQDEASAGYDAYALLHSGIDRCGNAWPVLLTAWGSGQNALMSYLAMPGIALFGLSELTVRLPNALAGCLTLPLLWFYARRARGPVFGVTALALLVFNPWHIMMSRWALESNLLPFFLLLGILCTSLARYRPWMMAGAGAAFGLSLYAYGAAFFFLPLYLAAAVVWLRREIRRVPGAFCVSLALFLLLAAPIALCQLRNALGLDSLRILGLTLPRLTEGRQAAVSVFGGGSALENFRGFLRLLWTQSDGLPWNSLPVLWGGIFYVFGLPTAVLGFLASLFCRRARPEEAPLRFAVMASLVCAFLISGNINRMNMVWLPLVYFSAVGCHLILRQMGSWAAAPAAAMLACFLLFCFAYPGRFGGAGNVNYFPGLGGAIEYAASLERGPVYVTRRVNQPYIFALIYTRTPPEDFVQSVEYADENAAFRQALRFDGFEFDRPERAGVLVLRRGETEGAEILAESGDFAVCLPAAAEG